MKTPTTEHEWTAEMINATLKDRPFAASTIASMHNASIAAVRNQWKGHTIGEIHQKIQKGLADARNTPEYRQEGLELELAELSEQLAAERKKRRKQGDIIKEWQDFGVKLSKYLDGVTTDEWVYSAQQLRSQLRAAQAMIAEVEEHNIRGVLHPDALKTFWTNK